MEGRLGTKIIIAGGVGLLAGSVMSANGPGSPVWYRDADFFMVIVLSLLVIGLAAWHLFDFGLAPLVAIALLAVGALMFNLFDFADGTPLWEQGRSGSRLLGGWIVIVSSIAVMAGVVWSMVTHPAEVGAAARWWSTRWIFVVLVLLGLRLVGLVTSDTAPPIETGDDGGGAESSDVWVAHLDAEGPGGHVVDMGWTFARDIDDTTGHGGRLIWEEAELGVCNLELHSAGSGLVQVRASFLVTDDCESTTPMRDTFAEHGFPGEACLWVETISTKDEHCDALELIESG